MNPTESLEAWSKAINNYQIEEATRIAHDVIPYLLQQNATSKSTGITIGNWIYWVRTMCGFHEIAREPIDLNYVQ